MRKYSLPLIIFLVVLDVFLIGWIVLKNFHLVIFDPAGIIAEKQSKLFLTVAAIGLSVIGSVIASTFFIVWKYREDNQHAAYDPEWSGNKKLMLFWWLLPTLIIILTGTITWKSTYDLDPFKPIPSSTKPLTIQVVSLQWKWLFIYPEQGIATVNYVVFPEKTPLNFQLTADSPMNSFWIPRLGGQMYSMSGMVTKTHLMANQTGEFKGSTAEISGAGFASMKFIAKSTTDSEFADWVAQVKQSSQTLNKENYETLAKPSEHNKVVLYSTVDESLYNSIVMKYMAHPMKSKDETNSEGKTETEHSMHDM